MIFIEEIRFALYAILGGYLGAVFSLTVTKKIDIFLAFPTAMFGVLFIILMSLVLREGISKS